jgi:hypothetical protein
VETHHRRFMGFKWDYFGQDKCRIHHPEDWRLDCKALKVEGKCHYWRYSAPIERRLSCGTLATNGTNYFFPLLDSVFQGHRTRSRLPRTFSTLNLFQLSKKSLTTSSSRPSPQFLPQLRRHSLISAIPGLLPLQCPVSPIQYRC